MFIPEKVQRKLCHMNFNTWIKKFMAEIYIMHAFKISSLISSWEAVEKSQLPIVKFLIENLL